MGTKREIIIRFIGAIFTIWGIILLIKGDLTNGFLAIIIGELVDIEYRFKKILNPQE